MPNLFTDCGLKWLHFAPLQWPVEPKMEFVLADSFWVSVFAG